MRKLISICVSFMDQVWDTQKHFAQGTYEDFLPPGKEISQERAGGAQSDDEAVRKLSGTSRGEKLT